MCQIAPCELKAVFSKVCIFGVGLTKTLTLLLQRDLSSSLFGLVAAHGMVKISAAAVSKTGMLI